MNGLSRIRAPAAFMAAALLAIAAGVFALDRLFPPPLPGAVSTVVTDAGGRTLRAFPVADGRWRLAADLDAIDPAFVDALIEMEDRRFFLHPGVDALAVIRAAFDAARTGRISSGASTITMQTARLLEPRPRTIGAKLVEMLRALQLEARYSKQEILEMYLTLAPYGGNLEGVRAASWAYFGHEPERLTPDQVALLIALPQAPEARRPDLRPANATAARARILGRLQAAGLVRADIAAEAAEEPAPARGAFPALAWHAADEARRQAPGAAGIRTTLDLPLQQRMEALARSLAEAQGPEVQVSILVVETRSRAVRAAVGSAGRDRPGGWIDLTDRARSPGSTLKPVIYAMAFDDGRAAPGTLIADAPRRFAAYRPENFDRIFRGEVTVADALQHSLNVPAVHALDAVGARRFEAALRFSGAAPALPARAEADTGLTLALGGAGMTARQLAILYAALADGGRARPLVWLEDRIIPPDEADGYPLMTRASAETILEILRRSPHPGGRAPAALTQGAPQVAFKTGTSYGYRDAWAAGAAGGHVAVVWVGRADGGPRPGVTGREAALPALFDVFDAIAVRDPLLAAGRGAEAETRQAPPPAPLARFEAAGEPPQILFPPDGGEVWSDGPARGFVLAGRGRGPLRWFVDGQPAARDAAGDPLWTPQAPGFYAVTATDADGRSSRALVRVRMAETG
ncbi:MAG: penicillin-binding protein 1C [Maricaulaceae bacterium]|nr:penicillin-binding protein 1C [Maricaulaceae bacterium]